MKFLLDQDVYASTARLLAGLGHDAVSVARLNLSEASDSDLLRAARDQRRILVTRDRDFGGLAQLPQLEVFLTFFDPLSESDHR